MERSVKDRVSQGGIPQGLMPMLNPPFRTPLSDLNHFCVALAWMFHKQ